MDLTVMSKARALAKQFLTFTALIRSYASMNSQVLNEIRFAGKGFSTFPAFVRSLSSVKSLMFSENKFAAKAFTTALIWPFSSVDTPVSKEVRKLSKGLPTFTTHKASLQCDLSNAEQDQICR